MPLISAPVNFASAPLREGGVDQYWGGNAGDGATLWPTGRSLAEDLEAVVGVVVLTYEIEPVLNGLTRKSTNLK